MEKTGNSDAGYTGWVICGGLRMDVGKMRKKSASRWMMTGGPIGEERKDNKHEEAHTVFV